ncbi:MAG TPA: hypothetical protein VIK33_14445 [Anaerolineae bacterium]
MRKPLALFLVVILVFPMMIATLSVISVSAWVLDRNFYTDLLGDERLYEVLLSEDLPNYFGRRIVTEADSIPAGALSHALREIVTPEYLRGEALRIVDDVFDFIEGRNFTLDLYLDIAPLKAALRGEAGPRFSRALAEALPTCAAGQESVAPGGTIQRCRPSDVSVDEATGIINAALPLFLDKFPDRISLERNPIDMRVELRGSEFVTGFFGANGLSLAVFILAAITAAFWFTAALIGGESRRGQLLWLGWPLIVPAVLIFLIGLAINSDFSANWVRFGLNQARLEGVEYSAEFRQALLEVARGALNTISNGFLMAGGVAGAIALGLIAWGYSTPAERRYVPPMSSAPMGSPMVAPPVPQPQPPAQPPSEPPSEPSGTST